MDGLHKSRKGFLTVGGFFLSLITLLCMLWGTGACAAAATVNDFAQLKAAIAAGGEIALGGDIKVTQTLEVERNVTLTSGQYTLTLADEAPTMFNVSGKGTQLSIANATLIGASGKAGKLIHVGLGATLDLNGESGAVTLKGAAIGVDLEFGNNLGDPKTDDHEGGSLFIGGTIHISENTQNVRLAGVEDCHPSVPQTYNNYILVSTGKLSGSIGITLSGDTKAELNKILFAKSGSTEMLTWSDAQVFFSDAGGALPARGGYSPSYHPYEPYQRGRWLRFEKEEDASIMVYGANGTDYAQKYYLEYALQAATITKWDQWKAPNCQNENGSGTTYLVLRGEGPYTLNSNAYLSGRNSLHILAEQDAVINVFGTDRFLSTAAGEYAGSFKIGGTALGMGSGKITFNSHADGDDVATLYLYAGNLNIEDVAGKVKVEVQSNDYDRTLTIENSELREMDIYCGQSKTNATLTNVNMDTLQLEARGSSQKPYSLKLEGKTNIDRIRYPNGMDGVVCPDMSKVSDDSSIGLEMVWSGYNWENPYYVGYTDPDKKSSFLHVAAVADHNEHLDAFAVEGSYIYPAEGSVNGVGYRHLEDAVAAANAMTETNVTIGMPWGGTKGIEVSRTMVVDADKNITLKLVEPYKSNIVSARETREIKKAPGFDGPLFDVSGTLTLDDVQVKGNCAVQTGGVVGITNNGSLTIADLHGGTLAVNDKIDGLRLNLKTDYEHGAVLNNFATTPSGSIISGWTVYDEVNANNDAVRICEPVLSGKEVTLSAKKSSVVMSIYEGTGEAKTKTTCAGYKDLAAAYTALNGIMSETSQKKLDVEFYLQESGEVGRSLATGNYGNSYSAANVEIIAREGSPVTLTYTNKDKDKGTMLFAQDNLTLTGDLTIKGLGSDVINSYWLIGAGKTLTLNEGVTITGHHTLGSTHGAVMANEIIINGATISGNFNTGGPAAFRAGNVTMNGGSITGNGSRAGVGAVLVIPSGNFKVRGNVNISGNTVAEWNAGGTPGSTDTAANVKGVVTIIGELTGDGKIGLITSPGDSIVARGTAGYQITEADMAHLSLDVETERALALIDSQNVVKLSMGENALSVYDSEGKPVADVLDIVNALKPNNNVVTIEINQGITTTSAITIPKGKTVRLMGNTWDLGTHTLTNDGVVEGPGTIVGTISTAGKGAFINGVENTVNGKPNLTYPLSLERGGTITTYNTLKNALTAAKAEDKVVLSANVTNAENCPTVLAGVTLEIPKGITLMNKAGITVAGTLTGAGTVNLEAVLTMESGSTLGEDIQFTGTRPLQTTVDLDKDTRFEAKYNMRDYDTYTQYFGTLSGAGTYSDTYSNNYEVSILMLRDAKAGDWVGVGSSSSSAKVSTLDLQGHTLTVPKGRTLRCYGKAKITSTGGENGTVINHGTVRIETARSYEKVTWQGDGKFVNVSEGDLSAVKPVAKRGTDTFYGNLADALREEDSNDVTLLSDAEISEAVKSGCTTFSKSLVLNGKTLTITEKGSILCSKQTDPCSIKATTPSNLVVNGLCGLQVYTANITLTGNGGVKTPMGDHVIKVGGYCYPIQVALNNAAASTVPADKTVMIAENYTIAADKKITIPEGVTLGVTDTYSPPTITNKGTLVIEGVLDRAKITNDGGKVYGTGILTNVSGTGLGNVPSLDVDGVGYLTNEDGVLDADVVNGAIANATSTGEYLYMTIRPTALTLSDSLVIPNHKYKMSVSGPLEKLTLPDGRPIFVVENGGKLHVSRPQGTPLDLFFADVKTGGTISVSAGSVTATIGKIRLGEGCAVEVTSKAQTGTANPIATLSLADPDAYQVGRVMLTASSSAYLGNDMEYRFPIDDVNYKVGFKDWDEECRLALNNNLKVTITAVEDDKITTQPYTGAAIDVRALFTVTPAGANITYALASENTGDGILEGNNLYPSAMGEFVIEARYVSWEAYISSAKATLTVAKGKASPPAAPTLSSATDNAITLNAIFGAQYRRGEGAWQETPTFDNLEPDTKYSFTARIKESDLMAASEPSAAAEFSTEVKRSPAPTAAEAYTLDYKRETLTILKECEAFSDAGLQATWVQPSELPGTTLYVRFKATDAEPASAALTVNVPARPDAPTGITTQNMVGSVEGAINGVDSTMEWMKQGGTTYDPVTETTIEITEPGTYLVRVKATASAFASVAQELTIGKCALELTAPTFGSVSYGYDQPNALAVTVKNTGDAAATVTAATLDGAAFTLTGADGTVAGSATDTTTWMVRPIAGLDAGPFTGTLTLTYDSGATATCEICFTVSKATPTAEMVIFTSPSNLAAGAEGKEAKLTARPDARGMGEITVEYYKGTEKLAAAPTEAGAYTVQGVVDEGDNYLVATLTDNGWTYTITQDKEVTGISVKTQPKLTYLAGEAPDMSALVATIQYNDGTGADVGYADFGDDITLALEDENEWGALPQALTLGDDKMRIRLTKGDFTVNTEALTVTEPVARDGDGKLFATLEAAVEQSENVILLKDISLDALTIAEGKDIVLDLGGFTLTVPTITVDGTLRLKNGTVTGKILNQSLNTVYINGVPVTGGIESKGGRVVIEAVPAEGKLEIIMTDPKDSVELGSGVTAGDITVKTGTSVEDATLDAAATVGNKLYFSAETALEQASTGEKVVLGEKASITGPVTVADGITVDTSSAPADLVTGGGEIKGGAVTYETKTEAGLHAAASAAGAGDTVKVTAEITLNQDVEIKGDLKTESGGSITTGGKELTVGGEVGGSITGTIHVLIVRGDHANGTIRLYAPDGDTDLWGANGTYKAEALGSLRVVAEPDSGYSFTKFEGATVDKDGIFPVRYKGLRISATFTANPPPSGGGGGPVGIPVTGVKLSAQTLAIKAGEGALLTATVEPENAQNKEVTWQSADPAIATVQGGQVTAVAEGRTEITVTTVEGGFTAKCVVTVTEEAPEEPEGPVANMDVLALRKGRLFPLGGLVEGFKGDWTSSDRTVASISENGQRVKTRKLGQVMLTFHVREAKPGAKYMGKTVEQGDDIRVTLHVVSDANEVSHMKLSAGSLLLAPGESAQVKATVAPKRAKHKQVFWKSGNEKVFTVDADGKVTAVGKGKAVLTATSTSGKTKQITVTVRDEVAKLTLNVAKKTIKKGNTFALTLKEHLPAALPQPALTWKSSKPKIAQVDDQGIVTALKKGKATITATAPNGAKVSCKITVK